MANEINIRNKRASFDYEFLEEYNAGIVLTGTEINPYEQAKPASSIPTVSLTGANYG